MRYACFNGKRFALRDTMSYDEKKPGHHRGVPTESPSRQEQITSRPRQKAKGNVISSLLGSAPLEITVKIPDEDKRLLSESLKEMADRMDFRWKRTQQLILLGYLLTSGSFIITKFLL